MIDLFEMNDFLKASELQELRKDLIDSAADPAGLLANRGYGGANASVRRTKLLEPAPQVRERVTAKMLQAKGALEQHFGQALGACEPLQFLRYEAGDFFVPHQDGNTPLVYDQSRFRRITTVLFLSDADDYEGGDLVLHGSGADQSMRVAVSAQAGTLVAFRAETTHEVTTVTGGERCTVVGFFCAPGVGAA